MAQDGAADGDELRCGNAACTHWVPAAAAAFFLLVFGSEEDQTGYDGSAVGPVGDAQFLDVTFIQSQ